MKIIKNDFSLEFDTWDDPGDYPNGVASGPLPSYDYVCEVNGEILMEIEPEDVECEFTHLHDAGVEDQLQELASEHADIPSGIRVTEWAWSYPAHNQVSFSVQDFDASDYTPDDPRDDYDEDRYYDRYDRYGY